MVSEKTSKERQAYWVGVINEARAYPDGVTAYCRKYNISKPGYYMLSFSVVSVTRFQ